MNSDPIAPPDRPERIRLLDLLRRVAKEVSGAPSMVLYDGNSYKCIPTLLADDIERELAVPARTHQEEKCSCEVDRHDFNCPIHNDAPDHPKRGPNGDE